MVDDERQQIDRPFRQVYHFTGGLKLRYFHVALTNIHLPHCSKAPERPFAQPRNFCHFYPSLTLLVAPQISV